MQQGGRRDHGQGHARLVKARDLGNLAQLQGLAAARPGQPVPRAERSGTGSAWPLNSLTRPATPVKNAIRQVGAGMKVTRAAVANTL